MFLLFDGRLRTFYPGPAGTSPDLVAMQRAFDCRSYQSCLDLAAAADIDLPQCPCSRYEQDPAAIRWKDVAACQHLTLAVCWPAAYELLQAIMTAPGRREKYRMLRQGAAMLGLRKRSML